MSSCGNPAVETEALMSRRLKFDKSRYCVKCKTNAGNIVIRHAVYCKECFSPLQITKFKRSLEPCINPASLSSSGPRRMKLKATGNLTIGFSGGLGSTVLLDLVRRCYFPSSEEIADGEIQGKHKGGTKHPRNQNVWNEARVCYVEICGAFPESEVQDRTEEVRKVVETYESFEFIPLRIESAFDPKWWEMVGGRDELKERELGVDLSDEELVLSSLQNSPSNTSISPKAALRAHLSRLPTMTATQSTITTLTRLILLYTAHSTSSSHLLLGTTLTGLSIGLISGIAMGGGFVVREEAGEEWAPKVNGNKSIEPSVKVVRPLKDMGMKECAAWVWWNQLNVVGKEKVAGGKQGIGGLTKDFVVGLERDYPSTVSTIARTCGKLAPKDAASERCAMCERPAQKGVQDWKARISIRSFSTPGTDTSIPPPHIPPSTLKSSTLLEKPPSSLSLTPHLCYACHTTLTSRSSRGTALLQSRNLNTDGQLPSTTPLPLWVNSHLRDPIVPHSNGADVKGEIWHGKMLGRADMRDQVKDFILDD